MAKSEDIWRGARGQNYFNWQVERWLDGLGPSNGDTGVAMVRGGVLRAAMASTKGPLQLRPADSATSRPCTP